MPALGDAVTVDTPAWSGTVANVQEDTDDRGTVIFAKVTATNTDTAGASAAPFGLSDSPNGSTTFGYRKISRSRVARTTGDETRLELECWEEGLLPGQTVQLTNVLFGYSADDFTIVDCQVGWDRDDHAVYRIHLGDAIVTMKVWLATPEAGILPIDHTKITDGEVTTPKLAANAVTAAKIAAEAVTRRADRAVRRSNLVTNAGVRAATATTAAGSTQSRPGEVTASGTAAKWQTVGCRIAAWRDLRFEATALNGTDEEYRQSDYVPIIPGAVYRARAWVHGLGSNDAAARTTVAIIWYNASHTYVSSSYARLTVATSVVLGRQPQ